MPTIPNTFYRISVKALILDEQKRFLLLFEKKGYWELPGGGLDFGEKSQQCLKRELKEETGLEVVSIADRPAYFVTAKHLDGRWKSNILYEVKVKDFDFKPSDECVEMRFFTKEEATKEQLYPIVKEFLKEYNPENH